MTLRRGHGNGRGVPRIEVMPPDELPAGVAAPSGPDVPRDAAGRFRPGPGTRAIARRATEVRESNRRLAQLLGLRSVPDDHPYAPYSRMAREWRDQHIRELARTVGGGHVGPGPASIVSTAALQLAASRYLADLGAESGSAKTLLDASRLADASRQNLLAAHELAAREATARAAAERSSGLALVDAHYQALLAEDAAASADTPSDDTAEPIPSEDADDSEVDQ